MNFCWIFVVIVVFLLFLIPIRLCFSFILISTISSQSFHVLAKTIEMCGKVLLLFWGQRKGINEENLHFLSSVIFRNNDHFHFSLASLRLKPLLLERSFHELEVNFRTYWRALITIACNLHRTRELRCLFVELAEKIIDPWRQNNWAPEQVKHFLSAVTQSVLDLEISR